MFSVRLVSTTGVGEGLGDGVGEGLGDGVGKGSFPISTRQAERVNKNTITARKGTA